jgi:hypothetical protein
LIRQIDGDKGPATALKAIIRAGQQYQFNRQDRWSDSEKSVIGSIDGQSIYSGFFKLVPLETRREGHVLLHPRIGLRAKEPDRKSAEGVTFRDASLRAVFSGA